MSVEALPSFRIEERGRISQAFRERNVFEYRDATRHIRELPYGRTEGGFDAVLSEERGTCSTKHGLLAALADEHEQPVTLMLGIYEMDGENTPGVEGVLERFSMPCLPEAHCYLRCDGTRVDVTTKGTPVIDRIDGFLLEQPITPGQVGEYKRGVHRAFLDEWLDETGLDMEADEAWLVRERCIEALSGL